MNDATRLEYPRIALYVFGTLFIAGIYPLMTIWPAGWRWEPRQPEYERMIVGLYATLGVFLILAARNPLAHRSLISFTIWSGLVHAGIMLVQALIDRTERSNLLGDVPASVLVAVRLWALLPRARDLSSDPLDTYIKET
jgi:prepilin signal peptidase PulO-like enzyme (type II secretory pathway)